MAVAGLAKDLDNKEGGGFASVYITKIATCQTVLALRTKDMEILDVEFSTGQYLYLLVMNGAAKKENQIELVAINYKIGRSFSVK